MLPKPLRALWGDLTVTELKKFGVLALIITLILGNYWMVRVMKNAVFRDFVSTSDLPSAKILSLVVMVFFVSGYSKLVDMFEKHVLFYILCSFYAVIFTLIGFSLWAPEWFTLPEGSALLPYFNWIPGKLMGWIAYVAIESSSLLMFLFWAFTASVTSTESAKKGYPMIVFCIQIGTVSSTFLVSVLAEKVGLAALFLFASIIVMIVPFVVKYYMNNIPKDKDVVVVSEKKEKPGFFAGLTLIFTRPYVMGIFFVSTVYEIVATILEFQMNMLADQVYKSKEAFATFTAYYGIGVNVLAMTFALLGTSFIMRRFGIRFCLIMYPAIVGIAVASLLIGNQIMSAPPVMLMWMFFSAMIAVKGFSYALNNPTKEVMYIPTSKAIRFKAKTWIESFGGRSAKGAGSVVNTAFKHSLSDLLAVGSIISLGIVGIWLAVAATLGKKYNKLQESKQTIS